VVIELDGLGGPPSGLISVDGGLGRAFYGWIDLTARLEALMPETDVTSIHAASRAGQARRG
jgi:hypothetical protein